MYDQLGHAFLRLFGPHPVDWIAFDRNEFSALGGQCLGRAFDPAFGMDPCVIADARATRGIFVQPVGDAGLRYAHILPVFAIDLFPHLKRVTTIGEDRRLFRQYYG